ncbi:hypothetical protein [Glutamicibacter sp. NPDC087344]|uniref:hypothetical protein n=1 Tax=Glutamicibacter sp. NPDC087344 TaxID=3363994 RepID=UPI0037FBA17B
MAGTSRSASQSKADSELRIRVRYGRLSLAVLGLLAVLATVVGGVLAPFTALTFGWVGIFFLVGLGSFASLRMLAVRDRNRKLLASLEATRQRAMQTPAISDDANQVLVRKPESTEVFDARPGSARRAPAITAQELRAEALRVAHGLGGVKQPETWEPTNVPLPTYVQAREATQREIAARVAAEPLPVSEPLRPSKQISLKAAEDAKRIASEVSAEDRAAVASVPAKLAPAAATPADATPVAANPSAAIGSTAAPAAAGVQPVAANPASTGEDNDSNATRGGIGAPEKTAAASKTRLNLDAVMQRRRA